MRKPRQVLAIMPLFLLAGLAVAGDAIVTLNPESLVRPFKDRFSHGKVVPPNATWLYTAGETGIAKDGSFGKDIQEQADITMKKLHTIVTEAGMDADDVVKMTIYYLDPAYLPVIVAARNRYFGENFRPVSTAVGISALAQPGLLVEAEIVAAKVMEK